MTASIDTLQHERDSESLRLPTPAELKAALPIKHNLEHQIAEQRQSIRRLLNDADDRLMIIVGPCSIDSEEAALEYGQRLAQLSAELKDELFIVMRAYVEKPRTTLGWKGLAYDPLRNGQGNMALGLHSSRRILLQLAELGLPIATEALHPLVMNYISDLVSWVAIGARTSESQPHRELVSDLPCPVGIKNGTDGRIHNAINAMRASSSQHHTLTINGDGQIGMKNTAGNIDTHLVLRGGHGLTNYDKESIEQAISLLLFNQCRPKVLVDCNHDNSLRQHRKQTTISHDVIDQRIAGNVNVLGLMLESYIEDGKQEDGHPPLFGQSITDPCLSWVDTENLLRSLHTKLKSGRA